MILALIIDTSAHMNQLTASGYPIINVVQSIVHFFGVADMQAIQIIQDCHPEDKVALFTGDTTGIVSLYNLEGASAIVQRLEANGISNSQKLIRNAVNSIHEYLLSKECDTFVANRVLSHR